MKLKKIIIVSCLFTSCTSSTSEKIMKKEHHVSNISVLISGKGREIEITDLANDTVIPIELSREVYLIELNREGLLKTSLGYGQEFSIESSDKNAKNDLALNYIESKDSVFINNKQHAIFSMADKIYSKKEFHTKSSPTDSWLVKLKLDDKTIIYFVSEPVYETRLDLNYMKIIDLIVGESPIKVREYR